MTLKRMQIKSGTKYSNNFKLANDIKTKLDPKFPWYKWTVIVHDEEDKHEITVGKTQNSLVQKARIHLIHLEKGFHVNDGIKRTIEGQIRPDLLGNLCLKTKYF